MVTDQFAMKKCGFGSGHYIFIQSLLNLNSIYLFWSVVFQQAFLFLVISCFVSNPDMFMVNIIPVSLLFLKY